MMGYISCIICHLLDRVCLHFYVHAGAKFGVIAPSGFSCAALVLSTHSWETPRLGSLDSPCRCGTATLSVNTIVFYLVYAVRSMSCAGFWVPPTPTGWSAPDSVSRFLGAGNDYHSTLIFCWMGSLVCTPRGIIESLNASTGNAPVFVGFGR